LCQFQENSYYSATILIRFDRSNSNDSKRKKLSFYIDLQHKTSTADMFKFSSPPSGALMMEAVSFSKMSSQYPSDYMVQQSIRQPSSISNCLIYGMAA
jgi:hypothetical protein